MGHREFVGLLWCPRMWEGAQFLTQMMLQHPFDTASCFPTDGIAALIGKAAEASWGRGKNGSAVILKGGL